MRDDAYEGVPSVFDLVRAKAKGMTEEQAYREHGRKVNEEASKKAKAKTAGFMDHLRKALGGVGGALKPLAKEPALVAAIAAPLVGAGFGELSKHRSAVRQAKAKAQNYRTMMELHPRLRIHDQQEIGRIYNTLHNVNPTMGSDPLVAGAWIDNIMENKGTLGEASSNQALLTAVKDLSGIRSSLSQALRNERGDSHPGGRAESFITGLGKDVEKAMHGGIAKKEEALKKRIEEETKTFNQHMDARTATFAERYARQRGELERMYQQVQDYAQDTHKKASDDSNVLELFFQAAGIT